jgi:hypothetical protein
MVVKIKKSGVPPILLYSVAGGVAVFLTIVFAARSVLIPNQMPMCSERYARANTLPYSGQSGALLTPIQLQSQLFERDWGLAANSRIVKDRGTPAAVAMEVNLPEGGSAGGTADNPVSGVGFKWTPSFIEQAESACVTYSVWLPSDFKFGSGGVLPGLYGGSPNGEPVNGAKPFFATRVKWLKDGKVGLNFTGPGRPRGVDVVSKDSWFEMPRGRWVAIEQEVVLNNPGKKNGVMRLWVDGSLQIERPGIEYRREPEAGFAGVWADTYYTSLRSVDWAPAPATTQVRLTPMVVRWQ